MKSIAAKYVAFLRQPHVARLLTVGLVSRMPIGMVGFSMLMFLREALGNFALAGTAVGVCFVSMAAAGPIVGRAIDQLGPRKPLFVTGVVQPLALFGVWLSADRGAPYGVVLAFAALSGVFASPITTLTRTIWRNLFEREEDRRTAFALDSVTIEINFTLGPAVVAGVLALASPRAAFALAIAVVVMAYLVYLGSGVLALFRRVETQERHLLGPLTEPRLWLVFITIFGTCLCFGLCEVGYPAYGTFRVDAAMGGVLLALNAMGSAVGGAIYGGMHFKAPVERQYAVAMAIMGVPLLLHALFLEPAWFFAAVAFLLGVFIAPTITAHSVLVSRFAPAKYATEAFTWSSTFIVSGLGAGMALGGALVENAGLRPAFAAGAATMAAMSLAAFVLMSPRSPQTVRAGD
ncbi:MAG TPA: MFS transporter [Usitatibacter sp.]|nr:MFS transporter [Usitatibacter sp.]